MSKVISLEELAKHNTEEDLWVAIHGNVYNLTEFIKEHPGGPKPLTFNAGKDATEGFDHINHSDSAKKWKESFLVGKLEGQGCSGIGGCLLSNWKGIGLAIGVPVAVILAMKFMSSRS